ncbi:MAG: 4a-hydroxytetrahydrobiopterin dehydratase [Bdellovibrionia bacterium]
MYTSIIKSDNDEIWLGSCPGWLPTCDGELLRIYNFTSYKEAIEFVGEIGLAASMSQHFPDIVIQGMKVTLKLKTHPVHGLTDKDFEFIQRVEELPFAEIDMETGEIH